MRQMSVACGEKSETLAARARLSPWRTCEMRHHDEICDQRWPFRDEVIVGNRKWQLPVHEQIARTLQRSSLMSDF
jgi:hypothetical protein